MSTPRTPVGFGPMRKAFVEHPVRHHEVPTEHAVSLPVPTLRWSVPAFAGFAAPAVRRPGEPLRMNDPDRWWALTVDGRGLVAYGLTAAVPFSTADDLPARAEVDRGGRSLAAHQEDVRRLDELMDAAVVPFLTGAPLGTTARVDLHEALVAVITPSVLPWYRALAPDFFGWLEEGPGD